MGGGGGREALTETVGEPLLLSRLESAYYKLSFSIQYAFH